MHLSNKKSPGTIPLWCWLGNKPLLTKPARRSLPLLFPRLPTSSNNCAVFYYDECLPRSTWMRWMDWLLFLFLHGEWNGLVLNFLIFCFYGLCMAYGYGLWRLEMSSRWDDERRNFVADDTDGGITSTRLGWVVSTGLSGWSEISGALSAWFGLSSMPTSYQNTSK